MIVVTVKTEFCVFIFVLGLNVFFYCVASDVLTAVTMQSTVSWDVTPCIPVGVHRRFGGTYCLHIQGRRYAKQASKLILLAVGYLLRLFFDPTYLRNVGEFLPDYTTSHLRRRSSSSVFAAHCMS
jgi:hypothetical protein